MGVAVAQCRQRVEPGEEEGAVGYPLECGFAPADRCAENDEVQSRRNHRCDDALHQRASGARHLEFVDRAYRVNVHGAYFLSLTRVTKMSSSELCVVCRSLNRMPAWVRSLSSAAIPARSPCSS